jgi:hypothetical protein
VRASETAAVHGLPAVEPAHVLYDLLFAFAPTPDGDPSAGTANADARTAWLPERWRMRATQVLAASGRLAQEHVGLELLQADRGWIEALGRQVAVLTDAMPIATRGRCPPAQPSCTGS